MVWFLSALSLRCIFCKREGSRTCTLVSVFKIMSNQAILVWRIAEESTWGGRRVRSALLASPSHYSTYLAATDETSRGVARSRLLDIVVLMDDSLLRSTSIFVILLWAPRNYKNPDRRSKVLQRQLKSDDALCYFIPLFSHFPIYNVRIKNAVKESA